MRRTAILFALLSPAFLAACSAIDVDERGPFDARTDLALEGRQLNFLAGARSYEDEAFGRLDGPVLLALDYCEPMGFENVRLEGGLHYAFDEADGTSGGQDVRLKGETLELSAGLNYSYLFGRLRPYLGLGAALLFLEQRGIDEDIDVVFDDDDVAGGGYAKAGILLQVSRTSHVGLEFRHFEGGEVTLDGTDLATSYDQFVLVFGTSFE